MNLGMNPYSDPLYVLVLFVALIPVVVSMLAFGKRLQWYQLIISFIFLYITFSGPSARQGIALIGYVIFEAFLVGWYFYYRQKRNNSWIFYVTVLVAIIPLIFDKVTPALDHRQSIFSFLGLSYLTFRTVQMIMEMRDGVITEYHPWRFIQFLIFFPTISSGPIDRYRRFESDLLTPPDREKYLELLQKGVNNIMIGCLYKFILAYLFGSVAKPYIEQGINNYTGSIQIWCLIGYMYVYTFDLFFDFGGYSRFAVGISYLMGYDVPINFNKPFAAWNIKEFWNRWHMSLSFWFRDFIYMRLMYTLLKKKIFKSRIVASNVGYFALFLIMGFWHGLTWYYIAYGLYMATAICINDAWLRYKRKHRQQIPHNKLTHALAVVITFNVFAVGLLIFSGILDKFI